MFARDTRGLSKRCPSMISASLTKSEYLCQGAAQAPFLIEASSERHEQALAPGSLELPADVLHPARRAPTQFTLPPYQISASVALRPLFCSFSHFISGAK
jgi:hypothetical protein